MESQLARRIIGNALRRILRLLVLIAPLACVTASLHSSQPISILERIQQRGYLQVLTIPGLTTYYRDAKGETGFEYLLAKGFADHLGVGLQVTQVDNINGLVIALGGPNGDFAAAGLTASPERRQQMRFTTPYGSVSQELLYRLGTGRPRQVDELDPQGRLLAIANSAHSETLRNLQKTDWPELAWEEVHLADMLGLMELVHSGEADYAVVDSLAHQVNQGIYPNARIAFQVAQEQPLAWAFPNYGDTSLLDAANHYLDLAQGNDQLSNLKERFFGHVDEFSVAGSKLFMRRVARRLPKYEEMFREAANIFDMDWHLLAAIAYQESHWNARAKSPTGVRGLMMLTLPTAREMGIKSRLDPEQSLMAGAQYFLKTKKRIPERITEPDRTWMALAAYNVGFGHLEDARVLTQRGGKNPDRWEDVKQFLPLLEQKKYYSTVKRGFARGREPVSYVQNIRHYRDILQLRSLEAERMEKLEMEKAFEERAARN